MKVSDYIVEFLVSKGIKDVFGYPGGMVTHLMDSFEKYKDKINAHVTYHEQGAAFAACGYAQVSGLPGVAYATSGPGATNLITGICNAYFDSIPTIFITGQVNTTEAKGDREIRQRGFQETDIVSMVSSITKYSAYIASPEDIPGQLVKAYHSAMDGRKGPVLLDVPMNVLRAEIETGEEKYQYKEKKSHCKEQQVLLIQKMLSEASCPCFLIGNGVKSCGKQQEIIEIVEAMKIPAVTSMIAFDIFADSRYNFGFIGAYGTRTANFIVAKSDLIIAVGSRLDIRQVGAKRENFAPEAKIIRFDVDEGELLYHTHDEICMNMEMEETVDLLKKVHYERDNTEWLEVCERIKNKLAGKDDRLPNTFVRKISKIIPPEVVITTDVGQNQVWVAQSFSVKKKQKVLFSGGHGAMGYSLPAAIGACHASGRKSTICFTGDGGLQMNIQELQYIVREQLPVKIIVLNNSALGMIRHFQEMYFEGNYFQTKPEGGYSAPCFADIAAAYGIASQKVHAEDELYIDEFVTNDRPFLLEVMLEGDTYVFPKLEFGKPNQDQEPLLERELYDEIMRMI